jgi:hypothetical protein
MEEDSDSSGRTSDYRVRDYILAVERYERGHKMMVAEALGRWRTAQEARAILDAQRAEEAAPGYKSGSNDYPYGRDEHGRVRREPAPRKAAEA